MASTSMTTLMPGDGTAVSPGRSTRDEKRISEPNRWLQKRYGQPKRSRPGRHVQLKLLAQRRHAREGIPGPFAVQRRPRVPRAFPPPQVLRTDQISHGLKFVVGELQAVHCVRILPAGPACTSREHKPICDHNGR